MNLGPNAVKDTYEYVLNQSGANLITLGDGTEVNWTTAGVPPATTTVAGFMSPADKAKLDGIINFVHPTQTAINANATENGVNVIDSVIVDNSGHVTAVTTRNLSAATQTISGVVSTSAQTFGGIKTFSNGIISSVGVTGTNLVFNTGNQTISGVKAFALRPTVNGTGVLLVGEGGEGGGSAPLIDVVFTTGDQTVGGIKTFSFNPISAAAQGTAANALTRRDFVTGNLIISGYTFKDSSNAFNLNNYTYVAGGELNTASSDFSNVAGGRSNSALGSRSNVAGGSLNRAIGIFSNVAGGLQNAASGDYSNVAGGQNNTASGDYSNVAGGLNNNALGSHSNVAGGQNNDALGSRSNVAGGQNNTASGDYSNVAGGQNNDALGSHSNVAGGQNNDALGPHSNVAGGQNNDALGSHSNVAGGQNNAALGSHSNVAGGVEHTISGEYSSVAGGRKALISATHSGAAVWADGQNRDHNSRSAHSCSLDFASGVYLRLPSFAGSSSQTGNLGELKISGEFLYMATGANLWGRAAISTF